MFEESVKSYYTKYKNKTEEKDGFLCLVDRGDNLYLYLADNPDAVINEKIVRMVHSDALLVSYAEGLIRTHILNSEGSFNKNLKNKLVGVMDNLVTWMSINGYMDLFPELKGVHDIDIWGESNFKKSYDEGETFFDDEERLFELSNGLVTHNCRLRLDLREMIRKSGGLFGAGDKTGSIGVVTLNLPKMAYIAKNRDFNLLEKYDINIPKTASDEEIFFLLIDYFCELAKDSLLIRRRWATSMLERGALPYTKKYLGDFDHHFNTIGVNGGHEACLNLLGKGIQSDEGRVLMEKVLDFILDKCADWQEKYSPLMFNLEAAPAEGCSTRFARKDKKLHPGIITGAGTNGDFYTNSTQLPEDYSDDIFEVFKHQNSLQPKYTSGTVQHIYMKESTHNWHVVESLVKKLFTNYRLPYLSISPNISVCPICGRLDGFYEVCPNEHSEEDIQRLLKEGVISEDDIIKE